MEHMMMCPGSLFVFSGKFIVLELKKKSLAPGEMSHHYDVIIFLVNPTLVYQMHMNVDSCGLFPAFLSHL